MAISRTRTQGWAPTSLCPGSPVGQTSRMVVRMIHVSRIPDPTKGQSLVQLDFLGLYNTFFFYP